jgi:aryl-alcohol dehydrogenase-like predicted oxidoreductase
MGMSGMYGPADRTEAIATIHAALDAGITFLDTGDFYGMGHNELLIGEALKGIRRDRVVVSVKFGALRDPDGGWSGYDGRPQAVKNYLAYSLQRLGSRPHDIYRPSRIDPNVPIEETIGDRRHGEGRLCAAHRLVRSVRRRCRRAAAVPISDLQIEYSLVSRGIEDEILPTCRELGIGVTAYGVLSRGLISGHWRKGSTGPNDFRTHSPRFQGANVDANLALVDALRRVAAAKGISVAQAAIAWVAAQGSDIVPLVGARSP